MTKGSQSRRSRRAKSRVKEPRPGTLVGNMGVPIGLSELNVHGVSATSARGGEKVEIWTRLAMTSDDSMFHKIAQNLSNVVHHAAAQDGKSVLFDRVSTILIVIHKDNQAEVWLDAAAVQLNMLLKRAANAGEPIFEGDIVDITGMDFPLVEIGATDRVICLFREGWRFGLYFDFNPDERFDRKSMCSALGALHRTMRYRRLYDALANEPLFKRLVEAGWFPFAEIITSEFTNLLGSCEAGFDLAEDEEKIIASFDEARLERIFSRWMLKPHFAGKEELLRTAISAFLAKQPVATIKVLLTEIEGILAEAYKAVHGRRAKLKTLLSFAVQSAAEKTGAPDTLLFPTVFAKYLESYTFAPFDPDGPQPKAGSRHAVGHGAADTQSYTMARALQVILTLDQLAFYT
jgi:hypothetical protein